MKISSRVLVSAISTLAVGVVLIGAPAPSRSDTPGQSQLLNTGPVTPNNPSVNSQSRSRSVYSPEKLNNAADGISGKTNKPKEPSIVPDGLLPASVMESVEPPAADPVDPIDFLKVEPLDSGVAVPINRF